ncbi:MAG TPA: hypothetical protein VFG20_23820 [Planctomycetaceae bacterium]|nr:hypothetical protein [Planctomycetaceae bacterium]
MMFSSRFTAPVIAGVMFFLAGMTAHAQHMPMLVLDSSAKTAYIVDSNDPTRVAAAPFPDAPALRKGTFRKVYRTPNSIFYLVTVADGASHLLTRLVEFNLTGASPSPTGNVGSLPVSNTAVSFSATCNGKYLVVCGDGATPVSVINVATGAEVDTLALPNNVSNVFCAQDDVSVLAIEKDALEAGLGVRRLTINATGELTDTTEVLNLPGAYAVIQVPGTGFGVALNRSPMTDFATAFTLAGMTSNGGVALTGETAESLAFSCAGTNLVVRSRVTGAPIETASVVESFGFNAETGTITSPAAFSFPVAAAGELPAPGLNLVNISTDGNLIAAAEQGTVKLYSSTDGTFVREYAQAGLAAGDVTFLSCCQFASVHPPIEEQVINGPDVNGDMAIDTEIPVRGATPSSYTFRIDLNVTSPVPVFVVEQVGPVWDVATVTADVATDRVIKFPTPLLGAIFNLPTYLIWIPSENNGSLTFETRTRGNLFPPGYKPNTAGPVPQTVGAKVFNVAFQPVYDDFGNPVIGTAYEVTGVPAAP